MVEETGFGDYHLRANIAEGERVKISREWSMPTRWTFEMKPVKKLLETHVRSGVWVDPFCGKSKIATLRNDLDQGNSEAQNHLMAADFLDRLEDGLADGVLFDPPYSPRQMSECYKSVGLKVNGEMTRSGWPREKDNIKRILKKGGLCISFGWSTSALGKTRGFEIIEILMIAHGGGHNDTLCTVERKL